LKDFVPDHTPVFHDLPNPAELDQMDVEPEAILDRRLVKKGGSAIPQGLIKWKNLGQDSATWEDLTVFKIRFRLGASTCFRGGQCNTGASQDTSR
jgi:hypothetical protein